MNGFWKSGPMRLAQEAGVLPLSKPSKDPFHMKTVDMNCANCDHSPESHDAGNGQCYSCPSSGRCPEWIGKTEEAKSVNKATRVPK